MPHTQSREVQSTIKVGFMVGTGRTHERRLTGRGQSVFDCSDCQRSNSISAIPTSITRTSAASRSLSMTGVRYTNISITATTPEKILIAIVISLSILRFAAGDLRHARLDQLLGADRAVADRARGVARAEPIESERIHAALNSRR